NRARRYPGVVGVEPGEDVAFGHLPAVVNRVEGAMIGASQPGDAVAVRPQYGCRAVRGAGVDDDAFDVGVVLAEDAVEGRAQQAGAVERRYDYGDERGVCHVSGSRQVLRVEGAGL